MTGWISLHRKIQYHELWQDKPFSRGQAWIDILLMVNHQDEKFFFDGKIVEVKRGSRITSIRKLCGRWGWSNTKVIRFLTMLEGEKMLSVFSDKKKTVLTVENYSLYQNEKSQKRHRNDTETTQKHTNNNDNNDNNDNKDIERGNKSPTPSKKFIPPEVEEIKIYCQERSNKIDAEQFFDFYQSKNWMVGKNKMKDWKAAIRNWERRKGEERGNTKTFDNFTKRNYDADELKKQLLKKTEELIKCDTR